MTKQYLIPEELDISLFRYPQKVAHILDRIYRYWISKAQYNDDAIDCRHLVPLASKKLEKEIGSRYVGISLKELREKKVLRRKSYQVGEHPFEYGFLSPYQEMVPKRVAFRDNVEDEELLMLRQREIQELDGEGYRRACSYLNLVTLEYTESHYIELKELVKEKCQIEYETDGDYWKRYRRSCAMSHQSCTRTWHDRFRDKWLFIEYCLAGIRESRGSRYVPFYCKDDYGRFHYYLSSFPKELRQLVRFDGKKIKAFDIKSSQVLFFVMTIRDEMEKEPRLSEIVDEINEFFPERSAYLRKINKRKLENEIRIMKNQLKDDFYCALMKMIGYDGDRDGFKNEFFRFLFGPDRSNSRLRTLFLKEFPAIYTLMWKIKNLGAMNHFERELECKLCQQIHDMKPDISSSELTRRVKNERNKMIGRDSSLYYGKLPCEMQRKESDFIFNRILPQISEPFLPLHDAVLMKRSSRTNIGKLIEKEFRKERIHSVVTVDYWD